MSTSQPVGVLVYLETFDIECDPGFYFHLNVSILRVTCIGPNEINLAYALDGCFPASSFPCLEIPKIEFAFPIKVEKKQVVYKCQSGREFMNSTSYVGIGRTAIVNCEDGKWILPSHGFRCGGK